jgi:hypothetical protein
MPARRLEDRIRELCARVLIESEPELTVTARELQRAIREHVMRVGNLTVAATVARRPYLIRERRRS